jgi:DNA-binding response OmpR family regulator
MTKILVVDDDPNVQRLLRVTLKQEGFEVIVAGDGAEGLRLWEVESPALILLDVTLAKLDGYEVAAKVREAEGTGAHVPIIMLTAGRRSSRRSAASAPGRTTTSSSRSTRPSSWPG